MEPQGEARGQVGLDASGIESLAVEHSPSLYRFAVSLVRDHATAEDLLQDAFLRAFERRASFRGDSSPVTWLRRILHNLAIDRARRGAREVLVEEVEERWRDDAYTIDSEAVIERAQTRAELEDALLRLPFIYRVVVLLHDVEDWTVAEIANALELGRPAAKQRLRRGGAMLVTALARGAERREALGGVPLSCWEARCNISDYLDDELDDETRTKLERHIEACPTCPPLYTALVGVKVELGGLRDPDSVVAPDLAERIAAAVRKRAEA